MIKMKTNQKVSHIGNEERPAVLVCVTSQRSCERLIRQGAVLAKQENCQLLVLSVQPNAPKYMRDGETLEYLFAVAMDYNAQMSVYFSNDTWRSASAYIRRQDIARFVVGVPHEEGSFVRNLIVNYPETPLAIVEDSYETLAGMTAVV